VKLTRRGEILLIVVGLLAFLLLMGIVGGIEQGLLGPGSGGQG
jgi:hypothetical protein